MASTIPANIAYSVTCGGGTWTGEPANLAQICAYLQTVNSGLPYVGRDTGTNIKVITPGQPFIAYPLSVSSVSCPWPYNVNGTVCEMDPTAEALLTQAITPPEPFDPQFAGQMWLTGLGFILMLYVTAAGVGYALKLLKGPRNSP